MVFCWIMVWHVENVPERTRVRAAAFALSFWPVTPVCHPYVSTDKTYRQNKNNNPITIFKSLYQVIMCLIKQTGESILLKISGSIKDIICSWMHWVTPLGMHFCGRGHSCDKRSVFVNTVKRAAHILSFEKRRHSQLNRYGSMVIVPVYVYTILVRDTYKTYWILREIFWSRTHINSTLSHPSATLFQ